VSDIIGESIHFLSYGEGHISVGGVYPMRKNAHNELIYLVSGQLYVCQGYSEFALSAGEALLLDGKSTRYGSRECKNDCVFRRVVFDGDLDSEKAHTSVYRHFTPAHPQRFTELLNLIHIYYSLPEYPDETIDLLVRLIITELYVDGIPAGGESASKFSLCAKICGYIRERNGVVKISEISDVFGYTSKYLSELFYTYYSRGLKSYTDAVRLSYIKMLLASDYTVAEVMKEAGFSSAKQMQDFFRYNTGMPMSEWIAFN